MASNLNLPSALLMSAEEADAAKTRHVTQEVKQRGKTVRQAKSSWGKVMGRRGSRFEVRLNPILERCGLDPSADEELAAKDYDLLRLGLLGLLFGLCQIELRWHYATINLNDSDDPNFSFVPSCGCEEGSVS